MNWFEILKYAGIFVGAFIAMLVTVYFAYPYLNKEGYEEAISDYEESLFEAIDENERDIIRQEFSQLSHEIESLKATEKRLLEQIDSLMLQNDSLTLQNDELRDQLENAAQIASDEAGGTQLQVAGSEHVAGSEQLVEAEDAAEVFQADGVQQEFAQFAEEEFIDRVKSLLNLEEEELAPIVSNMNDDQLKLLYMGGGTIQREKLLRVLEPERAARLMQEIML